MENLPVTFSIYPSTIPEYDPVTGITQDRRECLVLLSQPVAAEVTIELQVADKVKQRVKFERKDATTLLVEIPDNYFQQDRIIVYVSYNDTIIGADIIQNERPCEQLARILERALDPIQLMMEALGLRQDAEADLHMLDNDLAHVVSCNLLPAHLKVLFQEYRNIPESSGSSSRRCRFPTALHFAAYYGFEKLTGVLLESEGALPCLKVTNCDGDAVMDIAKKKGFKAIEHAVENALVYESVDDLIPQRGNEECSYMQMNPIKPTKDLSATHMLGTSPPVVSGLPQLPQNPPPHRTRTNSLGPVGPLQPIPETRKATEDGQAKGDWVLFPPGSYQDSGIGLRDSCTSHDSMASSDGSILYSSEEGSGDGRIGTKVKRSPPTRKIKRGNSLEQTDDGMPSVGHVITRRPSLPDVYCPSIMSDKTATPPPCQGPTYQNLKPPGPPPVPRKKTSLPAAFDMSELQNNNIFRQRQNSSSKTT